MSGVALFFACILVVIVVLALLFCFFVLGAAITSGLSSGAIFLPLVGLLA
jgi:hypothetical protein